MSWLMILSYAALLVLPLPAGELPLPLDAAILARARVILQRNMILVLVPLRGGKFFIDNIFNGEEDKSR